MLRRESVGVKPGCCFGGRAGLLNLLRCIQEVPKLISQTPVEVGLLDKDVVCADGSFSESVVDLCEPGSEGFNVHVRITDGIRQQLA